MMIRQAAIAALAVAALVPAVSNASPEKASAKACATAFASSIAAPGASAPAYKFAYRSGMSSSLADFYPTDYTFTLEAHDPKTGAAIARARCSTDYRGQVTAISAIPLDASAATPASAF